MSCLARNPLVRRPSSSVTSAVGGCVLFSCDHRTFLCSPNFAKTNTFTYSYAHVTAHSNFMGKDKRHILRQRNFAGNVSVYIESSLALQSICFRFLSINLFNRWSLVVGLRLIQLRRMALRPW